MSKPERRSLIDLRDYFYERIKALERTFNPDSPREKELALAVRAVEQHAFDMLNAAIHDIDQGFSR